MPTQEQVVFWGPAVAALLLVAITGFWRVSRNVVTIAHEGGHALVAVLTGRRLEGIKLHSDTSGLTVSRGRPSGPGMVFTAAAGYVTPPLLGLGFAALVAGDQVRLMLWLSIGLLAAVLIMTRNVFGVISVVVTGAILFAVSFYASDPVRDACAFGFCWFLLLGGVRPVWELQVKRWRRQARGSDADVLARLTGVPALLWVLVFLVVALGALVLGGGLLLER
jgi:hypothetical protein